MSKQSVKPVLLSEAQIQAIRKFRNSSASNQVSVLHLLSMKSLVDWWTKHCNSIWGKSTNLLMLKQFN